MTRTLSVDTNNDIFIGPSGSLDVAVGLQAVLHCCAQAAQTQLGEMILAVDQGVPNFETIWQGVPNVAQFEAYLRRAIESVPDVLAVDEVTIDASGGALTYVATIRTIYGIGAING